jgi:hypothetical protein
MVQTIVRIFVIGFCIASVSYWFWIIGTGGLKPGGG